MVPKVCGQRGSSVTGGSEGSAAVPELVVQYILITRHNQTRARHLTDLRNPGTRVTDSRARQWCSESEGMRCVTLLRSPQSYPRLAESTFES